MRSQNFTYAIEIKKNAIVAATKIMSRMVVFSVRARFSPSDNDVRLENQSVDLAG
jgi:hypothetical protein